MVDTAIISHVREFLRLLLDGESPSHARLAQSLDTLALVSHDCPDTSPADVDVDPPRADYEELYRVLSARFPDYGYYAVADPAEALQEEPLVGDAIDDLVDISRDLKEVLWRFENLGAEDALWYFRLSFESHWGRHLRELSLFLHAKRF